MSKEFYGEIVDPNATETFDKMCKYYFSEEEKGKISQRMARTIGEKQELEEEKKSVVKDYTSKLAAKGIEIHGDARRVYDGFELRSMPCWKIKDFSKDKVIYVRKDSSEIIDVVDMTDYDRQETMPSLEPEVKKEVETKKSEK